MYAIVTSRRELWDRFDEVTRLICRMIKKTGSHGQSAETVIGLMLQYAESELGFNLFKINEETGRLEGLLFAIANRTSSETWIEVVALSAPGIAADLKGEVFDMLAAWAKGLGATKILTVLTRSPAKFFKFFHAKLGFEPVGILLERRL